MVPCPYCSTPVDWVTVKAAAQVLGVKDARVRQMIAKGQLPGAVKYDPGSALQPLWKIPIATVLAYKESR